MLVIRYNTWWHVSELYSFITCYNHITLKIISSEEEDRESYSQLEVIWLIKDYQHWAVKMSCTIINYRLIATLSLLTKLRIICAGLNYKQSV